jgi:hypothetical protein
MSELLFPFFMSNSVTVNAIRLPSGEYCGSPTPLMSYRSAMVSARFSAVCAGAATATVETARMTRDAKKILMVNSRMLCVE